MKFYTLKVVEIRQETADSITLCFKQPGLRKIQYLAGQYLTLIFRINGRRYIRPYSFSSAPAVDKLLEVTVKRIHNGIVSNYIHDTISVGDSVEVMQPIGDFVHSIPANEIFLWGIGSGITPLISLAKQILVTDEIAKVNLIYGNRNYESTIFMNQLLNFSKLYPHRFLVSHFHTQLKVNPTIPGLIEGRIDREKALYILRELNQENLSLHYICGPAGFKDSVKDALRIIGIDDCFVFSEDFELIKNPEDLQDIHTQQVKLKFENSEFNLEVVKGQTILESALDAGIELPYSCQTGNCSTCKGRLLNGEVKMIGLSKKRDDLLFDEYLICCAHPVTNNVYIEII